MVPKAILAKKTGYYLGEVSHPWEVLADAGYEIDFVSPKGGNPPVDGFDLSDPINKKVLGKQAVPRENYPHLNTRTNKPSRL